MPEESPEKVIYPCRHFDQVKRVEKSPKAKPYYPLQSTNPIVIQSASEACHSEGIQCPKKLLGRVYLLERSSFLVKNN